MEINPPVPTNYLRYVHEFLFSLNLGLVTGMIIPEWFGTSLDFRLSFWINSHLHLHPHSNVGPYTVFSALALALALCILLLLRLSSRTFGTKWVLRSAAGIVSLLVLPTRWLYTTHLFPVPSGMGLPNPPRPLLLLELAGAIVCALLYLYAKWPLPGWGSVVLLVLHFGFWNWLFSGGLYFWHDPFRLVFPLAGLCSVLAWVLYVAQLAKNLQPPKPVPAQ